MSGSRPPRNLLDASSTETAPVGTERRSSPLTATYVEGQTIGDKYRLLRQLGEGGMASVWVAHNMDLDIHVAIKFIRSDLQTGDLTSRLLQEARAAARLGHPAIVRVSDFGKTERGDPYIVMELLNGEDLGAALKRRGPVPALRAVRTLLPIADALATAHSKKIVHRDLKPENIFLAQSDDGKTQPKLVDFGIAKLEREGDKRITQIGAAMGSPAYMSPEQARGLDVDPRTDVWAFSVVLYETLTGQLPFNGTTYTALVCAILEAKPKPITELGAGDAELWGIIAKGLQKEPDQRWPDMREFGQALARWAMARGASDDVAGSSLQSTWIERSPDSIPMGTPGSALPPASELSVAVRSPHASAPVATQLSATVGGQARAKSRSVLLLVGAIAIVAGTVLAVVVVKTATGDKAGPIGSEPTLGRAPSAEQVLALPKVESSAPVVEPSFGAEPSAEPAPIKKPPVSGKPGKSTDKKPPEKPLENPPQKPPEKPPQKPPEKPPETDLKPF